MDSESIQNYFKYSRMHQDSFNRDYKWVNQMHIHLWRLLINIIFAPKMRSLLNESNASFTIQAEMGCNHSGSCRAVCIV